MSLMPPATTAVIVVRNRRQRDVALAAHWEAARQRCAADPRLHLAYIQNAYQQAKRGSKAIIVWLETGLEQDTWFHGWRATSGTFVVLAGSTGYGPHNRNPNVFYVNLGGVVDVLPGNARLARERGVRRADANEN